MKVLLFAFLIVSSGAFAQVTSPLFTDSRGKIIKSTTYDDVSGSPYLLEKWEKGSVKTGSGKTFADLNLKYDIAGERLLYLNKQGDSMTFAEPIVAFELNSEKSAVPLKFVNSLPKADNLKENTFLQIIATGKSSLYKKYNVAIIESKGYGAQSTKRLFNPSVTYYILKDGVLQKINLSKKSIASTFPSKEKEILDFLKVQKIDFKNDLDLQKLFDVINQ